MDYKQKYLKYKQKYLRLLKDQKGGQPFLMDLLAGLAFSWLFERNQRLLQLIYTERQSFPMPPLGNIILNHKYRLNLLGRSSLSIVLITRLTEGSQYKKIQLANRIMSRTYKLPEISPPTLSTTYDDTNGGHKDTVTSVAFHPTLHFFATSSWDNTAKIWRVNTSDDSKATCMATLNESNGGHNRWIYSVAFHPKEPILASVSDDNTIKLWYLNTPDGSNVTCIVTLDESKNGHNNRIFSVKFHPTLSFFVTCSLDNTAKLWLLEASDRWDIKATCVATLPHNSYVQSGVFHPTLHLLATISDSNTIKLWNFSPNGSNATCVITLVENKNVLSIAFHPTLPLLATGFNNSVKLWHLDTSDSSNIKMSHVSTLEGDDKIIFSIAFHPTLPLLATGSNDKTVKLWHLNTTDELTASCIATLNDHNDSVSSVVFHPTKPLLVTCSDDKTIKMWKL
jgi:WD40 repeat protein